MTIYKYTAFNTEDTLDDKITIKAPSLCMPKRFCSTCRLTPNKYCVTIPEQPNSYVKKILKSVQYKLPNDLCKQMFTAADNNDYENDIWEKIERYGALSPSQYSLIVSKIKKSMLFDDNRYLLPNEPFGQYKVKIKRSLNVDVILGVSNSVCAILTPKAVSELVSSCLTGYFIYPLSVSGILKCDLFTIVVNGNAGLPKILEGDAIWCKCPDCGEWWLIGDGDNIRLGKPCVWDKTDFFHVEGLGGVYVSPRCKDWLSDCSLNLINKFEDISSYSFMPHLNKHWKCKSML